MFIHSALGLVFTYMTIWLAVRATLYLKARIEFNVHSIGGFFLLFFILILTASGYVTMYFARNKEWEQHTIENWRYFHKKAGWVFVFIGLITSASGVLQYYQEFEPTMPFAFQYAIYSYLLFFFLIGATELHF